jgi:hypothetical protein
MGTENSNRRFLNGPHIKILLPFILLSKNMPPRFIKFCCTFPPESAPRKLSKRVVKIAIAIYLTFAGNFFPKKVGNSIFQTKVRKWFLADRRQRL